MKSGYIPLVTSRTWDPDSDTPVKFGVGYAYARNLSTGQVTYNIAVEIDPLPTDKWNTKFGYPIYAQVYIRNGAVPWTRVAWAAGNGTDDVYTFKAATPQNWTTALSNNTVNVNLNANPGDNVQLMVHLYSSGSLPSRNIVFLWGRGIPDESTKQVSSKSTVVSSTPLNVPAPAGASLTGVPSNITISEPTGQAYAGVYISNTTSNHYYKLTATLNGTVVGTSLFTQGSTYEVGLSRSTILSKLPTSTIGEIQYALTTYSDSNRQTQVGQPSYMTGKCTIDTTSIKPNVSSVSTQLWYDSSKYQNIDAQYIQNITGIQITGISSSAGSGATIARYEVGLGGRTYTFTPSDINPSGTPPTPVIPLDVSGSITPSITAYDSRDAFATSNIGTYDVLPYQTPQITGYSSVRCRQDGTEDVEGLYFSAKISTDISPIRALRMLQTLPGPTGTTQGYVQYGGTNYYTSGMHYMDAPDGSNITVYVQHPKKSVVYVNGEPVAEWTDSALHSYTLSFDRDMSATVAGGPNSDYCWIVITRYTSQMPKLAVSYKKTSDTTWTSGGTHNIVGSPITPAPVIGSGHIEADASYDIKYTVRDRYSSTGVTVQDYLSSAEYTLFLAKGGKAISVGEVYTPAEGSDEKVLNISNDWVVHRGGEPAIRNVSGWTVRYLGDSYVEMWREISCTVSSWTAWSSGGVYYSANRFGAAYPATFDTVPFVTATIRTYYTSSTDHPNLWLLSDAQDSANTAARQLSMTPDYVLACVGSLGNTIHAEIALHVFGKLATS